MSTCFHRNRCHDCTGTQPKYKLPDFCPNPKFISGFREGSIQIFLVIIDIKTSAKSATTTEQNLLQSLLSRDGYSILRPEARIEQKHFSSRQNRAKESLPNSSEIYDCWQEETAAKYLLTDSRPHKDCNSSLMGAEMTIIWMVKGGTHYEDCNPSASVQTDSLLFLIGCKRRAVRCLSLRYQLS